MTKCSHDLLAILTQYIVEIISVWKLDDSAICVSITEQCCDSVLSRCLPWDSQVELFLFIHSTFPSL